MRVRPLTLPSYWSTWAMPACDWSKSGGQRAAPETSTISSVSVEKNVFFASVNYARVQYYTLTFTTTYWNQIVPFWNSSGGYLVESLIKFLVLHHVYLIHYFYLLLLLHPYPSIIVGRKILMSRFTAHVTFCPPKRTDCYFIFFKTFLNKFSGRFFSRIFWKRKHDGQN